MANEEHLNILKQGVEVWNKWREDNPTVVPDLSLAILVEAHLGGACLDGADLTEANLIDADFRNADLTDANLSGAKLKGATFMYADVPTGNEGCPAVGYYLVTPPNETTSAVVPANGATPCGGRISFTPMMVTPL